MHLYGIIIGIALVIYYQLTKHGWNKSGLPETNYTPTFILGLSFTLSGARLYHVLDYWEYYRMAPWLIPQIWQGGLGIIGGLFFAFCFLLMFSVVKRLPALLVLNIFTSHLLLALGIGRLANIFSGDGFWLESVPLLVSYAILITIKRKRDLSYNYPLIYFLFIYGLIRLVTDRFRTDLWYVTNLPVSTLVASLMVLGGLTLVIITRVRLKAGGQI